MSRCSQTEALQRFARLTDADAGRLQGQCLYFTHRPIPPGTLDGQAATLLHASVYRAPSEPVTADTLFYVVSSDGTPVAWVDYQARVSVPKAALTPYQRAHQAQAVVALSQPTRDALAMLARLRDGRERRDPGQQPTKAGLDARVRVASAADPTLTFWTRITADAVQSRQHVQTVIGAVDEPLLLEVFGYGEFGLRCPRLGLDILCTVEHLAAAHGISTQVVGDWLYAEGAANAAGLTPLHIEAEFAASFAGVFDSKPAFARAQRDTRGWTELLTQHGIALDLFDDRRFASMLFTDEFWAVPMHDYRIAVFRREQGPRP